MSMQAKTSIELPGRISLVEAVVGTVRYRNDSKRRIITFKANNIHTKNYLSYNN